MESPPLNQDRLPQARWADRAVFQLRFLRGLGRLPLPGHHPLATYNDFLLARMLRDDWTPLERAAIDKEHAKLIAAALCPGIAVAATRAVHHLDRPAALALLARDLAARAGLAQVAKPTHGSGALLFLRQRPGPAKTQGFLAAAAEDFWRSARESQYRGLPRKVIIEDDLSEGEAPPADYKFFCARGEVLFCELVTGRFVSYRRHLVSADFSRNLAPGAAAGAGLPAPPGNLAGLIRTARQLSAPFRFVRVDLYELGGVVHFGELTFVPHAATGAWRASAPRARGRPRLRAGAARSPAPSGRWRAPRRSAPTAAPAARAPARRSARRRRRARLAHAASGRRTSWAGCR